MGNNGFGRILPEYLNQLYPESYLKFQLLVCSGIVSYVYLIVYFSNWMKNKLGTFRTVHKKLV